MRYSQKKSESLGSGVYITTLGCPKNIVDSNHLKKRLLEAGIPLSDTLEDAGVIIVNTCGFIEDAKREAIEEILKIRAIKKGSILVAMGCLIKRYRKELLRSLPEVDVFFGIGEEEKIVWFIKDLFGSRGNEGINIEPKFQESPDERTLPILSHTRKTDRSYAYIKISDGCNRRCSFCIIPKIKGPYRSIEPEKILSEAEDLISQGYKELILVGQEISSYGIDRRKGEGNSKGFPSLRELLKEITSIKGDFWVRLLYLHPASINDELIEEIASNPKICKYIDIPLQHSEDRILRLMKRPGSKEFYRRLIKKLRNSIPELTLRTTFIVGFPGETEEEFSALKKFVKEMEFERVGVFKYNREEGTPAFSLKKQVPKKIKERRFDELMTLQTEISLKKNLQMIGKRVRCLIDEIEVAEDKKELNGGRAYGRLQSHAPEIDGMVIINLKTRELLKDLKPSTFTDVIITKAYDYDLQAEMVK